MKAKVKKSINNRKKPVAPPGRILKEGKTPKKQQVNIKQKNPVKNRVPTGNKVNGTNKFVKGQSGNPNGRPVGSKNKFSVATLQKSIQAVEKRERQSFLEAWVECSWGNPSDMATIANFMLPKLKSIEQITFAADSMEVEEAKSIREEIQKRFKTEVGEKGNIKRSL